MIRQAVLLPEAYEPMSRQPTGDESTQEPARTLGIRERPKSFARSLLLLCLCLMTGCDQKFDQISGSAAPTPDQNDLALGNQIALVAGGQSPNPSGALGQQWRGYQDTDLNSFQAALPDYLKPYAAEYITAGRQYGIDPLLLASITEEESGTSGPSYAFTNRNNAMGISPGDGGPRNFDSVGDSITYAARILSNRNGAYKNDDTIQQLWMTYSPPDAKNDPNNTNGGWGPAVATFYTNLEGKVRGGQ